MTSTYLVQNAGNWFTINTFGHIIDRHFNMPDEYLKKRAVSHNKKITSTFTDCKLLDIYEMVIDSITDAAEEIVDWMDDWMDDGCWGLYINLPRTISGRQYVREENKFYECDMALIILGKFDNGKKIKIQTAFPYSKQYEPAIQN